MKDKIEIYNLAGEMVTIDSADDFYHIIESELEEKGEITQKVKRISLILMSSNGDIYVQKRAKHKVSNIGIYDKTVGGHIIVGDTFERALIIECGKELGIPAVIEPAKEFKERAFSSNLRKVAVCRKIDYLPDFMAKKVLKNGDKFSQPYMKTVYVGYYDGEIQFIDGKDSTMEKIPLAELQKMLVTNPYDLTHDLKFILDKYGKFLIPLKNK